MQKVIKGYKKNGNGELVDGLGGNLQYFKTSLIKKKKNRDQVKIDLTLRCTEMLCVKENIFNLETEADDYKIFSSNKKNEFLCVYYNFIEDTFDDFLKELKKLKGKKHIYMFSLENEIDKSLFPGIKNIKIEAIPQNILDVYKQLVKMNIPVKTNIIFTDLNKAKNIGLKNMFDLPKDILDGNKNEDEYQMAYSNRKSTKLLCFLIFERVMGGQVCCLVFESCPILAFRRFVYYATVNNGSFLFNVIFTLN